MIINGLILVLILCLCEGDEVIICVINCLFVVILIYWYGILLFYQMDGVFGISFKGIVFGEIFIYCFILCQSGIYWYYSYFGFQEMMGMYGVLIIEF